MRVKDLQEDELQFFYSTYLKTLDEQEELKSALLKGRKSIEDLVHGLTDEQLLLSYGEGKWTVAEVLVHIIDTERVFQYRAFRISRNDKTPLPGFDHNIFVLESKANQRTKEDILAEYLNVRDASISLFDAMQDENLRRVGTASGIPWSVAALGLVISGHQKHHENILQERYFN
ncbi:DinB family protein [Maribacter sp. SA7]|uniref:DinB family protein n=1 Tax=Maribacter zhoushanensis TaxID=3030012 RepID=UPI0023EC88B4|nr:DinB family protein [Maribacter zhoushanensis]MDF4203178.1 DinB family protein [Maribacter zhoushanensis]